MPNPYVYPKAKHIRTLNRKKFKNYKSYKSCLRVEFKGQCIYCRKPDSMDSTASKSTFGVDHYFPKESYPKLTTDYNNLFYACNNCNSLKGTYVPLAPVFIPNPVEHVMYQHLKFNQSRVQWESTQGQFTEELLRLNDSEVIKFRDAIISTISFYEDKLREIDSKIITMNERLKSQKINQTRFDQFFIAISNEKNKVECNLKLFSGTFP